MTKHLAEENWRKYESSLYVSIKRLKRLTGGRS